MMYATDKDIEDYKRHLRQGMDDAIIEALGTERGIEPPLCVERKSMLKFGRGAPQGRPGGGDR